MYGYFYPKYIILREQVSSKERNILKKLLLSKKLSHKHVA
jgi:hypothetical protein